MLGDITQVLPRGIGFRRSSLGVRPARAGTAFEDGCTRSTRASAPVEADGARSSGAGILIDHLPKRAVKSPHRRANNRTARPNVGSQSTDRSSGRRNCTGNLWAHTRRTARSRHTISRHPRAVGLATCCTPRCMNHHLPGRIPRTRSVRSGSGNRAPNMRTPSHTRRVTRRLRSRPYTGNAVLPAQNSSRRTGTHSARLRTSPACRRRAPRARGLRPTPPSCYGL